MRILVPVDFSAQGELAFAFGIQLAKQATADVVVLHVVPDLGPTLGRNSTVLLLKELMANAEKEMAAIIAKFIDKDVPLSNQIVHASSVHRALPALIETDGIDMIVMGTGRGPQIMEDQITYALVSNLQGIPNVKSIRANSMYELHIWARISVLERLNYTQRLLPDGVIPASGPDGTGLGHVFWYTLDAPGYDLGELRALQDWYIRLALQTVEGVSEVASYGGFEKQYQVIVDPLKLQYYNLPLMDVVREIRENNNDVGGSKFEQSNIGYIVRGIGYIKSIKEIENIPVATINGIPVRIRDIGNVRAKLIRFYRALLLH